MTKAELVGDPLGGSVPRVFITWICVLVSQAEAILQTGRYAAVAGLKSRPIFQAYSRFFRLVEGPGSSYGRPSNLVGKGSSLLRKLF